MRRRLSHQIFATLLAVGLACVLAATGAARLLDTGRGPLPPSARAVVERLAREHPAGAPLDLGPLAGELGLHLCAWGPEGALLACSGPTLPAPRGEEGWFSGPEGSGMHLRLADGRWIAGRSRSPDHSHRGAFALALGGVLGGLGLSSWLLSRRITRRLVRLERALQRWGEGELGARAPVAGRDELAALARTFNRAADQVQALVQSQQRVLASASHELRSPLARLRLSVELLGELSPAPAHPYTRAAIQDIEELDALVGDLLLSARLDGAPLPRTPVDLAALLDEEAARLGLALTWSARSAPAPPFHGDPASLRRLLRNLLENSRRHGAPPLHAQLEEAPEGLRLTLRDHGPGVPPELRERIFEPFYRPAGHDEGRDGGVGLGLALVRRVARAHGGEVRCEPAPGGGAAFVVTLPRG